MTDKDRKKIDYQFVPVPTSLLFALDPDCLMAIAIMIDKESYWMSRNSEMKEDVVYVGPMGCLTGMYIIMAGAYSVGDMRRLTIECLHDFHCEYTQLRITLSDGRAFADA